MQFAAPAEQYDRFMGRYAPTLAAALIETAGVTSGMRVVDVGCGPGGLTRELAARVGAAGCGPGDGRTVSIWPAGPRHGARQGASPLARIQRSATPASCWAR